MAKTIGEAIEDGEWEMYILTNTKEKIYPNDSNYQQEKDNFIKQVSFKYKSYLLVAARKKSL